MENIYLFQNDNKPFQIQGKFRDKQKIQCCKCGVHGHLQPQCNNTRKENQVFCKDCRSDGNFNQMVNSYTNKKVNVSNVISSSSFVENKIQMNGKKARCLFDINSELNLANYVTYHRLGSLKLFIDEIRFSAIANGLLTPLEYFSTDLHINGSSVRANIYVIRDLNKELVLGRDVISTFTYR